MNATRFKRVLFAAVAAVVSVTAFAADWVVDTGAKTLTLMDGEAVVWKFNCSFSGEGGKEISFTKLVSGKGDLDLRGIPDDYKVVNLGNVFQNTGATLTSLIEPDTLTMLNTYEFFNDSAFVSFTGGGSIVKISNNAFWNCPKLASFMSFPACETCGSSAFSGCSKITGVSFPLVMRIESGTFNGCSSCATFELNWSEFEYIGDDAFTGCSKLTGDLKLPKVTYFGGVRGTGVTSVDVPNAVTIANYAFYDTRNITNANFGAKTTYIGDDRVFYNCTKLVGDFSFPLMTYVPGQMFVGTKVTSVSFPAATNIHHSAFSGCSTITNFVFTPEIVTSIGDEAFSSTQISGDLRFPNLIRLAGFKWAQKVKSVYAPKVEIIGNYAFYGNTGITNLVLGSNVKNIEGLQNFLNCSNLKGDYDFGAVASIPNGFMANTRVTSLVLTNATSFAESCFDSITTLTNVMLGAATNLPDKLFYRCAFGCAVQFYGDVPTFGKNVFMTYLQNKWTPNTVFFYVRNRKFLENWTNACFALKGTPDFEPYRAQAPKRTIGVMYVGPEDAAENERDLAYVVNGTPSGMAILVK